MIIAITLLSVAVLALMVRVHLLEKTTQELALDILELNFDIQDLSGEKIAEEWINDWDLGDSCCKE